MSAAGEIDKRVMYRIAEVVARGSGCTQSGQGNPPLLGGCHRPELQASS